MTDRRPPVPPGAQPGGSLAASPVPPAAPGSSPAPAAAAEVEGQGFLSRWSRRKSLVREGQLVAPEPKLAAAPAQAVRSVSAAQAAQPPSGQDGSRAEHAGPPPAADASARVAPSQTPPAPAAAPPTLDDVERLTPGSDFSRFTARDVDPKVRNAAMRKLFHSEPQFNVMDGLDVYIDDYNTPDPLPKAIMRTMLQARALGLLDDELKEQDVPPDAQPASAVVDGLPASEAAQAPATTPTDGVAASDDKLALAEAQPAATTPPEAGALLTAPSEPTPPHEDLDLQLQPHHAPGHGRADAAAEHAGRERGGG